MTPVSILSTSVRELIAVGASIAGNCLPCLRYHFAEALKAGCILEEITQAIQLSKMVKERPMNDIYHLADELLRRERENTSTKTSEKEDTNANV
jgi:AhpD family alkylhydroperoxidase